MSVFRIIASSDLDSYRTCKINSNTLIGSHTTIASGASVSSSVIGQRCTIGSDVVLHNAYVFDGTTIGARSVVRQSIVGAKVQVGEGSTIERGSLVGDGVILGKNAKLGPFERVSRRKAEVLQELGADGEELEEDDDSEDEWEEVEKRECYFSVTCNSRDNFGFTDNYAGNCRPRKR